MKPFDFSDLPRNTDDTKLAGLKVAPAPTLEEMEDLVQRVLEVSGKPRHAYAWPPSELAWCPWLRRALPRALFRA